RGFNTEDYCDKSGEDTHYDISQETRSNLGDYNNIRDFYEDYYSQTRDKD
ncbi:6223_t:CDS:1, partial [Funneliformis geosporum]